MIYYNMIYCGWINGRLFQNQSMRRMWWCSIIQVCGDHGITRRRSSGDMHAAINVFAMHIVQQCIKYIYSYFIQQNINSFIFLFFVYWFVQKECYPNYLIVLYRFLRYQYEQFAVFQNQVIEMISYWYLVPLVVKTIREDGDIQFIDVDANPERTLLISLKSVTPIKCTIWRKQVMSRWMWWKRSMWSMPNCAPPGYLYSYSQANAGRIGHVGYIPWSSQIVIHWSSTHV